MTREYRRLSWTLWRSQEVAHICIPCAQYDRGQTPTKGIVNVEKFIVFIVLYFIVVNFVLPRFGIKPG